MVDRKWEKTIKKNSFWKDNDETTTNIIVSRILSNIKLGEGERKTFFFSIKRYQSQQQTGENTDTRQIIICNLEQCNARYGDKNTRKVLY